jgi:hypothetical protein
MAANAMKSRADWKEVTELTDQHLEAKKDFEDKKPGHHPYTLAYSVQKTRLDRDAARNELRDAFFIIEGGKK